MIIIVLESVILMALVISQENLERRETSHRRLSKGVNNGTK